MSKEIGPELDSSKRATRKLAVSATIHCLIGCMIGELIGVTIGSHSGMPPRAIALLAMTLAFISGYSFSTWPLLRQKIAFWPALRLVFSADTLSILTMAVADNIFMLVVPGAMDKDMLQPIYWLSRTAIVAIAFIVAYPVNYHLLRRGKGHALMHQYHNHHHRHGDNKVD